MGYYIAVEKKLNPELEELKMSNRIKESYKITMKLQRAMNARTRRAYAEWNSNPELIKKLRNFRARLNGEK